MIRKEQIKYYYNYMLIRMLAFSNDIGDDLAEVLTEVNIDELMSLCVNYINLNKDKLDALNRSNMIYILNFATANVQDKDKLTELEEVINNYKFSYDYDFYNTIFLKRLYGPDFSKKLNEKNSDHVDLVLNRTRLNEAFKSDFHILKSFTENDEEFNEKYMEKFLCNINFNEAINYLLVDNPIIFTEADTYDRVKKILKANNKLIGKQDNLFDYLMKLSFIKDNKKLIKRLDKNNYYDITNNLNTYFYMKIINNLMYTNEIVNSISVFDNILDKDVLKAIVCAVKESETDGTIFPIMKNNLFFIVGHYREKYKGDNEVYGLTNSLITILNNIETNNEKKEMKFLKKNLEYYELKKMYKNVDFNELSIENYRQAIYSVITHDIFVFEYLMIPSKENEEDEFISIFTANPLFLICANTIMKEMPDFIEKDQILKIKKILNLNEKLFICNDIPKDLVITDEIKEANKKLLHKIKR